MESHLRIMADAGRQIAVSQNSDQQGKAAAQAGQQFKVSHDSGFGRLHRLCHKGTGHDATRSQGTLGQRDAGAGTGGRRRLHGQSFQKSLNRCGDSSVYLTVC
jgi:hypothetical protein